MVTAAQALHAAADDDRFLAAVALGEQPSGHESNLRLAFLAQQRHGPPRGLEVTWEAVVARSRVTGGPSSWDLTATWYHRVCVAAAALPAAASFDDLLRHSSDLVAQGERRRSAG